MEFTGIQIAVSIIVIFGAAAVALLCDFLKRKNELLHEAMVELQMRRDGQQTQPDDPPPNAGPRLRRRSKAWNHLPHPSRLWNGPPLRWWTARPLR